MVSESDTDAGRRCQFRMYLGMDLSPSAHHCGSIQAVVSDQDQMYTGSRDATIKEWALDHDSHQFDCKGTFRGHTDWVTDLQIYQQTLISASSDKSIRIWDRQTGRCLETVRSHIDYVECIGVDYSSRTLVSGGLDNQLYIWDLNRMSEPISQLHHVESCASIYCLHVHDNMIITGSSDKIIRIWDSRSKSVVDRLLGHQGNIRNVFRRMKSLVSASSDGTVRIWDIAERRSISVYDPLTSQPIWSVSGDDGFRNIYAGGRSDQIACIDVLKGQTSLVCTSQNPNIHSIRLHLDRSETILYVATSDVNLSAIDVSALHQRQSSLPPDSFLIDTRDKSVLFACPPCRNTKLDIAGRPAVVAAVPLRDSRRVCTSNSLGEIELWDIVEQRKLSAIGKKSSLEEAVKRYDTEVSIPIWFSIDLHLGTLGIVLQISTVFSAEIWTEPTRAQPKQIKLGLHKVNLGAMALENALKNWIPVLSRKVSESLGDVNNALLRISESPQPSPVDGRTTSEGNQADEATSPLPEPVQSIPSPKHTLGVRAGDFESDLPCLIMSQQLIGSNSGLFRILNLYDPSEYDEIITPWVRSWIINGELPAIRRTEIKFEVRPHPDENRLPPMSIGTMKADESVTIRQLTSYIIQQLPAVNKTIESYQSGFDFDFPERILIISADNQIIKPTTSLRTARAFAWKNKSMPFTLFYRFNEDKS